MDVILFETVPNIGNRGAIVSVAPGYFRNYLSPQGLAVEATNDNRRRLENKITKLEKEAEEERKAARGIAEKIGDLVLTFTMKSAEEGKLFGSVTNIMIAEKMSEMGYDIDRHNIAIAEAIKRVGEFSATVKLHEDVNVEIKVIVEAEAGEEEAEVAEGAGDVIAPIAATEDTETPAE